MHETGDLHVRKLTLPDELLAAQQIVEQAFPGETTYNFDEELTKSWSSVWGVLDGSRVVGALLTWDVADELHIITIAVPQSQRRRGLGLLLMQRAMQQAFARGATLVVLEVKRSNTAAIALYRRLGFYVTQVRSEYYSNGEDGLNMSLRFDAATGEALKLPDEDIV